jgi:D-arabinose 1-dehydrogenase-like Zn-dependent alcohol dehydrogenase
MPCGECYCCRHFPEHSNRCQTSVYCGRYLGFEKVPHLWGGFAEYVDVDPGMLPGTKTCEMPTAPSIRKSRNGSSVQSALISPRQHC